MTTRSLANTVHPLRTRLSAAEHPNLYFWLTFLLLNCLLFLPAYLLNRETTTFLPLASDPATDPTGIVRRLFSWRNNLDIFRLNVEITLLLAAWVLLRRPWEPTANSRQPSENSSTGSVQAGQGRTRIFRVLFTAVTFLALVYAVYESLSMSIYQVNAVFYAHYQMVVDGLGFLFQHLQVPPLVIVSAVLIAVGAIAFITLLVRLLIGGIPMDGLNRGSRLILALLALLSLLAVLGYGQNLASPKSVASSLVFKIGKNTADSIALYHRVRAVDDLPFYQAYDYTGHNLLGKPNIYLIFIESYGGILYSHDRLRGSYTELLGELESELEQESWFAATALSESPTWGGGSWMAYTSALFGLRIDNHPQYLALQQRFANRGQGSGVRVQEEEYPDLGHYLQSQGYRYIGATSLAVELDDEAWQKYENFYGVDRWIRYSDLNYQGMHYGWGPSPPDQYVLNALNEEIRGQSDEPFLLFWITQNSHYPWRKIPEVVENWRAMDDGNAVVAVFDDDSRSLVEKQEDYLEAITYELSFLKEFILNEAGDDDIFILMGDHQPGYIGRRSDGFGTPLHIISKDRALVQGFSKYGFDPGLEVTERQERHVQEGTSENISPSMRHEGFYSLFMHVLLQQYGQGRNNPPPYLADGIQFADD